MMMKKLLMVMFVLAMFIVIPAMAADEPVVLTENGTLVENTSGIEPTENVAPISTPTPVPTVYGNGKYVPIVLDTGDGLGSLYVSVMCYHTMISNGIIIQKVDNSALPSDYVSGKRISKEKYDSLMSKPLGKPETIMLYPNGMFDSRYAPGTYALALNDGNGGQSEFAAVDIGVNQRSDVQFIGHAVSTEDQKKDTCGNLIITKALYGKVVSVNEYREKVVGDWSAWSSYKPYDWDHIDCDNKRTRLVECGGHWVGWGWSRHWVKDYVTEYSYRTESWSEWSTTMPHGYTEYGHDACNYQHRVSSTGVYNDVTSIVQNLVSCGHLSIVADYPNLHYNALFGDPVPGVFKDLIVNYDQNGNIGAKTVDEATDLNI